MSIKELDYIKNDIINHRDWRVSEPVHAPFKDSLKALEKELNFRCEDDKMMIMFIDNLKLQKESYPDQMALGLKYYYETLGHTSELNKDKTVEFLAAYTQVLLNLTYPSSAYEDSKKYFLEDERDLETKTTAYLEKHYSFNIDQYATDYYQEYYQELTQKMYQGINKNLAKLLKGKNDKSQKYDLIIEQIYLFYNNKSEHHYLKNLALINEMMDHKGPKKIYLFRKTNPEEKRINEIKESLAGLYLKDMPQLEEDIVSFKEGEYIAEPKEENSLIESSTVKQLGLKTYEIK